MSVRTRQLCLLRALQSLVQSKRDRDDREKRGFPKRRKALDIAPPPANGAGGGGDDDAGAAVDEGGGRGADDDDLILNDDDE